MYEFTRSIFFIFLSLPFRSWILASSFLYTSAFWLVILIARPVYPHGSRRSAPFLARRIQRDRRWSAIYRHPRLRYLSFSSLA
ncbi:hypothetical protein ASPBRDRAFT_230565 [Aspergillus brasiliensis CBS 101740]|uniref:Uncharacterized protein n=1 Tax=Aspergillus brasiliensis (strain CBS 101740 / IMI 381727 / IBT 21946) TaxID=767769 RepID=A0A1L9V032_ASPBC|nr:hypothetical protein ASPBRDRAFT_230565 [Aspergillus brasiliensis CBS 101740]